MNNFSLDDFFSAFKSLRSRGTSQCDSIGMSRQSRSGGCCESGRGYDTRFDCVDEDVRFDMPEPRGRRSGRSRGYEQGQYQDYECRHQEKHPVVRQDDCGCQQPPAPQKDCRPKEVPQQGCCDNQPPQAEPQTVIQQNTSSNRSDSFNMNVNVNETKNINNGIIDGCGSDIYDGEGDDIYAMGNRGIIDTDGNDIYARNYTVNHFNTINNFIKNEVKPTPTVEPTQSPTVEPDPPSPEDTSEVDLRPLKSLLNLLDFSAVGNRNGILDDNELTRATKNAGLADLDGNNKVISDAELAIFNKIKAFNEDKDLISNVMKGDYSNIDDATIEELQALSDAIKELTKNR